MSRVGTWTALFVAASMTLAACSQVRWVTITEASAIDPSATSLTVTIDGCAGGAVLPDPRLSESDTQIHLLFNLKLNYGNMKACLTGTIVHLAKPIGARKIIDDRHGQEIPITWTPVTPPEPVTTGLANPTLAGATSVSTPHDVIRVSIADGCPASVADHREGDSTAATWIINPDSSGLSETFVPGEPTEALLCRYAAVRAVTVLPEGGQLEGGALFSETHLGATTAAALAAALNEITPSTVTHGCVPPLDKPRFTAIVFAIEGRSDVDLWLKDWLACPEVSNGTRSSGELVNGVGTTFLTELDHAAPPAPQVATS